DKVSEGSAIVRMMSGGAADRADAAAPEKKSEAPSQAEAKPAGGPSAKADEPDPSTTAQVAPRIPLPLGTDYGNVHASPSVRRFAREFDIDLTRVTGTGEKGRITKDHLKRALTGTGGGGMGIPEIPAQDFAKFGPIETQPMSRLKRLAG